MFTLSKLKKVIHHDFDKSFIEENNTDFNKQFVEEYYPDFDFNIIIIFLGDFLGHSLGKHVYWAYEIE